MDDIVAIRLFLLVAEEGGFARAARRLGVSPAVATRKIAALEHRLGARVFQRSTRHVALTDDGHMFREHALRVVDAVDAALAATRTRHTPPSGHLRVVCHPDAGRDVVVPLLGAFRARFAQLTLTVHVDTPAVRGLSDGGGEIAITHEPAVGSHVLARRITPGRWLLVASPRYLQQRGVPQQPRDLATHECFGILPEHEQNIGLLTRDGHQQRCPVRAGLALNDAGTVLACVRAGLGIAMLNDWHVRDDLERGALVPVLPAFEPESPCAPLLALCARGDAYVPKVRAFIDFLCARFEPPAAADF